MWFPVMAAVHCHGPVTASHRVAADEADPDACMMQVLALSSAHAVQP